MAKALEPEIGFVERLVRFWTNHFCMSSDKSSIVRSTLGQLERDVIRVNVLGRFEDMLLGVMRHPAMISFLDNTHSVGPNSEVGLKFRSGINKNLARELLELYTLGVDGGYTENDITNVAMIITGWSYVRDWESDTGRNGGTPENRGQFIYRPKWHEPGTFAVLGRSYRARGMTQGEALMRDLVANPLTGEHLAFKLIRHFITDTPTSAMVVPVAEAFRSSGGDLRATSIALIDLAATWNRPLAKIRLPEELAIAELRAFALPLPTPDQEVTLTGAIRALNHSPWQHPQPDGYPDETAAWLNADGMRVRGEAAQLFVSRMTASMTRAPDVLARDLFDDALSAASRAAIAGAPTRNDAMTVLLMTPEFQRR